MVYAGRIVIPQNRQSHRLQHRGSRLLVMVGPHSLTDGKIHMRRPAQEEQGEEDPRKLLQDEEEDDEDAIRQVHLREFNHTALLGPIAWM